MNDGGETEADAITALHLAARRWCVDRHARWADEYERMQGARAFAFVKTYIDDDYRVFPRYIVLEALLAAIERWLPTDVATVDEARERLVDAAHHAQSPMTAIDHPLAREAMTDERAAFERFARTSTPAEWATAAPLPFRRVLSPPEADALDRAFAARWGTWYGGWPSRADLPPHLTLHAEVMEHLPVLDAVRAFFAARAIARVFHLCEFGDSYERDSADTDVSYDGREGRWFATDAPWMIYASHESSITFGGADLLDHLRAALPSLDTYDYRGWSDPPSSRPGFSPPGD